MRDPVLDALREEPTTPKRLAERTGMKGRDAEQALALYTERGFARYTTTGATGEGVRRVYWLKGE